LKGLPQFGQNFGMPLAKSITSPQSLHFIFRLGPSLVGFGVPQLLQNLPVLEVPHCGQSQ
jgi:hypothetical protein